MNAVPVFATVSRALLVLSVAVGLQYSSWHLPIVISTQWPSWVAGNVVLLFFAPLLLGYVMLSDAPTEFGMRVGEWRLGIKWSLGLFAAMLPILLISSQIPKFQQFYRAYLPPVNSSNDMLMLLATTTVYMVAWEFFFRGFLLFGLKPALGVSAVVVQAVMFMIGHLGKPTYEFVGSLPAGLILGALCWRTGAFWPGFVTHALVHNTFNFLVLR